MQDLQSRRLTTASETSADYPAKSLRSGLGAAGRGFGQAPGADHGEEDSGYATRSPPALPPGWPAPLPPLCQHSGLSCSFSPLCFQTGSARLSVTCCRVPGWRSEVSASLPVPACGAHRKPSPRRAP
ncbi:hypothetical protein PAL_GLEAN10023946 [Pteropus alecto]|uniref:Uncharacterized protein n=1 Tax=Pteropus alecto TaxID=9402 RepID=L5K6B0_PTEAL|nr:hypothetical protein PAL_GLEAN10023946 [Pteropus alecto]